MRKIGLVMLWVVVSVILTNNTYAETFQIIDQTGNLLINGNFETGNIKPWFPNNSPTVSISTDFKVDGDYSVFIDTYTNSAPERNTTGLVQDINAGNDYFTASTWVYPIAGQARIRLFWGGLGDVAISEPTTELETWNFIEVTAFVPGSLGTLFYGVASEDQFYVDGVWCNRGQTNLSPYAPQNGFILPPAPPNELPVADAGDDIYALAGEVVTLDGSFSFDPDGTIQKYEWINLSDTENPTIGEGEIIEITAHGYAQEIIQLRVTDDRWGTATDTMLIINPGVQGEQGPPGITPEEVAAMQSQITTLQQQNADQQRRLEEDRYLLQQLPQLKKELETLQQQTP